MLIVANILLIGVAGLITYWWANQGLFSSLLHLLCVIVAGATALAVWEPLAFMMIGGGGFDEYVWGITLIGVFVVTLFILRLVMDKLVPANVRMPGWADLTFGGAAGAAAAVLTVGIFVIGAGHVHSTNKLFGGIRGWARDSNKSAEIRQRDGLWVPFHTLTGNFYSWLSVTSLRSSRPLRQYSPEIDRQLFLIRDNYKGRSKITLKPSGATVDRLYFDNSGGKERFWVGIKFGLAAIDFGDQLTLSSAQIRLISDARGTAKPEVIYPIAWRQHSGYHRFDDVTHYVTSEPGKEETEALIEFVAPPGFNPRFIQIRGTRYALPQASAPPGSLMALSTGGKVAAVPTGGANIQNQIDITNSIRPVAVSINTLPSTIKTTEEDSKIYIASGKATFQQGRGVTSRALRVEGIFEPAGTRCVRLDVSRGGPADVFRFRDQAGPGATLALVDSTGNEYSPVGYFYKHSEGNTIHLEPTLRMRTLDDGIPVLPTSGTQELELMFYITKGAVITGFRFGDIDIGHCNVEVPDT